MNDAAAVDPAHWYATLPMPSVAGEAEGNAAVMLRSYSGTHALMEKPALTDDLVCVHQASAKRVHRWEGGTHRCWDVQQDAVSLMPRFRANRWWTEGPIAFTHVTLSGGLLARMAREELDRDPRDLAVVDKVGIHDPLVVHLIETLTETFRLALPGRLYQESLLTALIIRVLMRHSSMSTPHPTERARGGLAGWQLRRVIDYMAAHLAEDVGVAQFLGLVGLSRAQFFRAFRQSVGQTPGAYLLSLRLERARQLLAAPTGTIVDVARSVGFGSSDSFARAFRRSAGQSPAAWRRRYIRPGDDVEPP